jgi:2-oxoisovalerate dehydrogenase E1 component beta subunit
MEPKILYRAAVEQVPVADYELPLGRAELQAEVAGNGESPVA